MSVNAVNKTTGQLSRVAGKTANGELIPSVSLYQSGTVVITAKETAYGTYGITFPEPMPDDDYIVNLSISGLSGGNWHNKTFNVSYENKTKNGFVICVGKPNDTAIEAGVTVTWQAFKLMTDENRVLDEQQIAEHETEITAIQDVIPSSASADNQLATKNDIGAIDTSYQATKNLDFNDFKGENNKIINYWLRYGDTWDNCPTSSFGSIDWILLTVENVAGRVQQTVLIQKTNNKSERWTRAFVYADPTSQTVWGDWVKEVTSDDISEKTVWIAGTSTRVYRKVEIKGNSTFSGVIQLVTKSGDVYYISKRDGSNIKFTKVVNGVGGDAVAISGYEFDSTNYLLTLYLTLDAWASLRVDLLNAWSVEGQKNTSITVTSIAQSDIGGTVPTITNALVNTDVTSTVTSGSNAPLTSGGAYAALNTVTSGTATNVSAGVKSGGCTWKKVGRLVQVTISNVVFSDTTTSPTCFSGLPKALVQSATVAVHATSVKSGNNLCGTYLLNIMTDGTLSKGGADQVTSADGGCYGSFTYISAT